MRNERDAHVQELSKLSGNSKFILDSASGHNVEHDNPKDFEGFTRRSFNYLSTLPG